MYTSQELGSHKNHIAYVRNMAVENQEKVL